MPGLATLEGVELASVGTWECMTGTWECTSQDIQDAVAASAEPDWRAPVIKLGHTDPRFDGQPAVGTIRNLRASEDGTRLLGDLTDMPAWLADVMHSAYPSRSVEGVKKDIAASGKAYSFRLTALSLLGVEAPAIESLADVAKMYAVAAANSQQATGYGIPVVTVAHIPAPDVVSASTSKEGAGMTPEQLRETLGLPADASDIMVGAKLAALMQTAPPVTDPVVPPVIEPVAPVVEPVAVEPKDDIADHPIVKELRESLRLVTEQSESLVAAKAAEERDAFIRTAVVQARITPAEREHYEKLWDLSPELTREAVMARQAGKAVPVGSIGHADSPEANIGDAIDQELAAAFPDPDAGKGN